MLDKAHYSQFHVHRLCNHLTDFKTVKNYLPF